MSIRLAMIAAGLLMTAHPASATLRVGVDESTRVTGSAGEASVRLGGSVRDARGAPRVAVSVNGQVLPAVIGNRWQVSVPLADLRRWSTPYARHIDVQVVATDANGQTAMAKQRLRLPTAVLGRDPAAAHLVLTTR